MKKYSKTTKKSGTTGTAKTTAKAPKSMKGGQKKSSNMTSYNRTDGNTHSYPTKKKRPAKNPLFLNK